MRPPELPPVATVSNLVAFHDAPVAAAQPVTPGPAAQLPPLPPIPHHTHLIMGGGAASQETLVDTSLEPVQFALHPAQVTRAEPPQPAWSYLRRRDIAREVLRARLIHLAEQREHRSAYEIVFIVLGIALAILLAAPPLIKILLAARGIQS